MPARGLSLKARLVATFAMLITAVLLIVASIAFHLVRTHLDASLDRELLEAAKAFEAGPGTSPDGTLVRRARTWLAQQPVSRDRVLAVRTGPDRIIATSTDLDLSNGDVLSSLSSGEPVLRSIETDATTIRILSVPLEGDGEYAGTFLAATSRSDVESTLSALLAGVGWAGAAGLVLAGVSIALLIGNALGPLAEIAAGASAIERTGDLSRRVGYGDRPDEIGVLASAFDRMLERLEHSFERQHSFLSDTAHEIRTPMTVARGQLEILQNALTNLRDKQALASAVDEIDRIDRTIEDMLLLARLDEGASFVTEPVEIELVATDTALRVMRSTDRRISTSGPAEAAVRADPRRLSQVLENLLLNAVKHAGAHASIEVTWSVEDGAVLIRVSDDGIGMAPNDLDRIFDRHYRILRPGAGVTGAGLGLSIARSLTLAMGGQIRVTSAPDRGTTFTLVFPEPRMGETSVGSERRV